MPMKTTFTVEGFKEVGQALKSLGDEFAPAILRKALLDAAVIIRDEAMRRAPVDSGRLSQLIGRSSGISKGEVFAKVAGIELRSKFGKKAMIKAIKKKKIGKGKNGIVLTETAYWDRFVEYGTRFQKAQPYLRPAFDAKAEEFAAHVRDNMQKRIDKFIAKQKNQRSSKR
ncbi:MAG: HK97 gp10 family phage protein [Candidatus Melainabacteria bacterium]|nr:HK97 gp10 family phage protein [Candidatus Melainabacteria bacterium]